MMDSTTKPIILAIDPGYDRIGWAVGTKWKAKVQIIDYGCIQTTKTDDMMTRYRQINYELQEIVNNHRPVKAIIESLFFFKNQKTALKVSEARGVIISCLLRNGVEIKELTPLQIKSAVTGYGRADKKSVEKMVRMELKLENIDIIDDAIDALGMLMAV